MVAVFFHLAEWIGRESETFNKSGTLSIPDEGVKGGER
jgi:hypothetical protein